MAIRLGDTTISSYDSVDVFKYNGGDYWFSIQDPTEGNFERTQDEEEVLGRNNSLLRYKKKAPRATFTGNSGIVSHGLLEAQTGNEFALNSKYTVLNTDYVVTNAAGVTTLKQTPSEVVAVYAKDKNGIVVNTLGTSDYTLSGSTLTSSVYQSQDLLVIYYSVVDEAYTLTDTDDTLTGMASVYVNVTSEDLCGNLYRAQIYMPKADVKGEFSLDLTGSNSIHNFEFRSLGRACGFDGNWTYTIFGINA